MSMARRSFTTDDIVRVLTMWHAGHSQSRIAVSLGMDRKTVRKYLAPAARAGMAPGGPPVSRERWAELARQWFPALGDTRLRKPTWPVISPYREHIAEQLRGGASMSVVHQRLCEDEGLTISLATFRRWCQDNLNEPAGHPPLGQGHRG